MARRRGLRVCLQALGQSEFVCDGSKHRRAARRAANQGGALLEISHA